MLQSLAYLPFEWLSFVILAALGALSFVIGQTRALALQSMSGVRLTAGPGMHGLYLALWAVLPAIATMLICSLLDDVLVRRILITELPERLTSLPAAQLEQYLARTARFAELEGARFDQVFDDAVLARYLSLQALASMTTLALALVVGVSGLAYARRGQDIHAPVRVQLERGLERLFMACAALAIATMIVIVLSLVFESLRFFSEVSVLDFLFGFDWNPQTDQDFGALPLFFGTVAIAVLAMLVAVPVGLFAAIYLAEYASARNRRWIKPMLEVLAGVPTVVYGFFALIIIGPAVRSAALWVNQLPFVPDTFLAAQPTSALAAGFVMGVMIVPFVSSLTDDVLKAVPQSLRNGALAVGATKSEAIRHIILPAARPGIVAALLLAISRAIGETMIVLMAAGQRANMTLDPTADITTVTAQIVPLLTGASGFDNPVTLSAFALGGTLFGVTLIFNLVALRVGRKYREIYD